MVSHLPTLNACLNAASAVFLVAGLIAVKRKAIEAHKRLMVTAFAVSCLFLISYLAYHGLKGGVVTRFQGEGWIRPVYFGILISHTLLAAAVPFLAVFTIRYGLRCYSTAETHNEVRKLEKEQLELEQRGWSKELEAAHDDFLQLGEMISEMKTKDDEDLAREEESLAHLTDPKQEEFHRKFDAEVAPFFADHVYEMAVVLRASEIHFEWTGRVLKTRYRTDEGYEKGRPFRTDALLRRLKKVAHVDVSTSVSPLEQVFQMPIHGHLVKMQFVSTPSETGESVVIRFLDRRVLERSLDIDRHKRWARWTFPIWLYVSVTGVVIYWMLYHLYPEV